MPTLSIYVNHEIYSFMSKTGDKNTNPASIGKKWIEERYQKVRGN